MTTVETHLQKGKIMKNPKRVVNYIKEHLNEIKHTTLNPEGPGVVRIHMVPPKYDGPDPVSSVVIINGQDIIPINVSWAVLLSMLIDAINEYHGRPVNDEDIQNIIRVVVSERKDTDQETEVIEDEDEITEDKEVEVEEDL